MRSKERRYGDKTNERGRRGRGIERDGCWEKSMIYLPHFSLLIANPIFLSLVRVGGWKMEKSQQGNVMWRNRWLDRQGWRRGDGGTAMEMDQNKMDLRRGWSSNSIV
jgi:hypothetical protein